MLSVRNRLTRHRAEIALYPCFIAITILLLVTRAGFCSPLLRSPDTGNWKLIWADEFNEADGRLNPGKWHREEGFLRNEELQYYTDSSKNLQISNGKLVLTALKETLSNKDYWPEAPPHSKWVMTRPMAKYSSASITSENHFSFTYGRLDVRAALPRGNGLWPAIWLLGVNEKEVGWPECGEIDVMEHIGRLPNLIHASVHFKGSDGSPIRKSANAKLPRTSSDFHVYTMIWDKEGISILVDNERYFSIAFKDLPSLYRNTNPFKKPFFLKINLALGGKWAGPIDVGQLPQNMVIDYVRVYKRIE